MQSSTELLPEKPIALTFDDGPHPVTTPQIRKILKEEGVVATFFVVGRQIRKSPKILQDTIQEWFEIGTHSYRHASFQKISWIEVMTELWIPQSMTRLAGYTGASLFRFPYGILRDISPVSSVSVIWWDNDGLDWKRKQTAPLIKSIISQAHSGGIILMHDIKPNTVNSLRWLIRALKKEGYHFVKVSQLRTSHSPGTITYSASKTGSIIPKESPEELKRKEEMYELRY